MYGAPTALRPHFRTACRSRTPLRLSKRRALDPCVNHHLSWHSIASRITMCHHRFGRIQRISDAKQDIVSIREQQAY